MTFRDLLGTPFGRGFLSSSCPALATTPVSSTPSAKPRPACFFSFAHSSRRIHGFPCIKCINLQRFQKSFRPNPRSSLHLRPSAPPNCCHTCFHASVPPAQMRNEPTICVHLRSSAVPPV